MRWVASFGGVHHFGLNRRTAAFTQPVTANLLHGFAHGPAAAEHPTHDNLDSMHEWPGDPIAAQYNLWPPLRL
jgi:hypothetical protein